MTAKKKNRRPACRALVEVYKRTPPHGAAPPMDVPVRDYAVCGGGVHTVTITFEDDCGNPHVFQAGWTADTIELPDAMYNVDDIFDGEPTDFVRAWKRVKQVLYDDWGVMRWELQPGKGAIPRSMWAWVAGAVAAHRLNHYRNVSDPYAKWDAHQFDVDYLHYLHERHKSLKNELDEYCARPDSTKLRWLREQLDTAGTEKEKGDALEYLADYIFGLVERFKVLPREGTSSGQNDRRIRNTSTHPLLAQLGTYFIVECKNRQEPVSLEDVTKLANRLEDYGCNAGIFLSRLGLAGELSGAEPSAWKTATDIRKKHGVIIISLKDSNLDELAAGKSMAKIVVDAYERMRFA